MKTNRNFYVTFLVIAFASNVMSIYPDGMIHPSLMSWFQSQRPTAQTYVPRTQTPTAGTQYQTYPIENLIQLLSQGQRQSVHQGQLQGGQGSGFRQGQGFGLSQGQGLGFRQGQGLRRNQNQGQNFGFNQGQGQIRSQGQGVGRSQGKSTGLSQRMGTGLSQAKGSSRSQGPKQGLRQGTRQRTGSSRSRSRSSSNSNSMFSRYMMMRRAMRPRRFYVGQVVRPSGMFPGGTVISADGSDATVIDRYGMEHSFDSGRLVG